MKATDQPSPMSPSLYIRWDLRRRSKLMFRGVRFAVEPIAGIPGPVGAYVCGWGAAFALAALATYTMGDRGLLWVIAVGVAASVVNVVLRCESHLRWTSQALWVHAGALPVSVPLVICFAYLSLPVTQIVLFLAACVLALYLWSSWADNSSGTTTISRGVSSHVRSDGTPKVSYRLEGDAWVAARQFEDRTGERMNAYRCGACPDWHIGHAKA